MDSVSIREARRQLSELVNAAELGETVVITRHGREAARLVPPLPAGKGRLPDLTEFRASIALSGKPLSEVVVEARRRERF